MNNQELLDKEIEREIKNISLLKADESAAETERLCKLYKLTADQNASENEILIKDKQLKEAEKDRKGKFILEAVGVVLPVAAYLVCYYSGLKFEETGTFSSLWVKGLISKIKPR